jgi:hypothetical protein
MELFDPGKKRRFLQNHNSGFSSFVVSPIDLEHELSLN